MKREDYTYKPTSFDPSTPYFFNLKASDDIYDPVAGGYVSQTKYGYDESSVVSSGVTTQHIAVGSLRGNVTSQLHWSSADNGFIGVTHVYDDAGNVVSSTDALNHTTTYSYIDAYADQTCLVAGAGPTAAYPTLVTNVLGQAASASYNSCTGTKASSKDANGQTTSYVYYPTDQLKSVSYPDGGQESFCYDNTGPCTTPAPDPTVRNFTLTTQLMTPDPTVSKEEDYDGLGRSIATKVMSDPCRLTTVTTYDTMERVWTKSFPYFALTSGTVCQGTTPSTFTTYLYNGLGEPTSQQVTGYPARTWTYSSLTEVETDEVGNKTTRTLDGLGRLASVIEPDAASNAPATETDYQYDVENNLKQVDQWSALKGSGTDVQRTFAYDSLSRLTTSTNPEVGTITYGYDKNNNLTTSTDARGITATRSYDYLNRLTQTLYSDGTPTDCYYYDYPNNGGTGYAQSINSNPIGRLTAESTEEGNCQPFGFSGTAVLTFKLIGAPVGSTGPAGYDAMGRLVSDMQCPAGVCVTPYETQYRYDVGGQLDAQTVAGPTGPVTLTHTYDAGGRELQVSSSLSDAKHPATLFAGSSWSPFGLTAAQIGVASPSPAITMTRGYDSRGRTISESDSAPAVAAVPAVQSTATVNVAMAEQHTTTAGTPSTASITFAEPGGTDQYSAACSCYETGIFTLLVDVGQAGQVGYVAQDGTASTPTTIAAGLAASINGNSSSLVTATSTGPTLYLTSKADGEAANYAFVIQGAVTNPNFTTPSFTATASGPNMVGGSNSSGTTIYDAGTATIAIGSLTPASIAWTSADTAATIATRLAAAVTTADGTTVTATASGSQILLKGVTAGTAANIGLQTSTTYNTAYFSAPSVTLSGATGLTGGANAIPAQSAGAIYQYTSGAWAGNGNLQSMTDSILGTQSFTYDHLNRLTQAAFNGGKGNFTMAWGYDTYGNRKSESVSGTSSLSFTQPSPSSYLGASVQNGTPLTGAYNNRADGQNYDRSGNFLGSQFTPVFTYDAASRIETAGGVCYLYNAEGLRTAKGTWSEGECLNITAQYVLGAGDAQLAEFDGAGNWKHTNVFGGGKLLATYDALGTHFHLNDWLGTARLQVGITGAIDETCISLPFGDGLTCSGPGSDATEHHFTGKEHDAETGLDYFGARYFQSTAGRWMSPDWAAKTEPIPYAKMDNPQSLDLYAYVENNPLSLADADGHQGAGDCALGAAECQKRDKAKAASDAKAKKEAQQNPQTSDSITVTAKSHWWNRWASKISAAGIAIARFGRLGGPAHRAAVARVAKQMEAEGYKVTFEKYVRTPGGEKSGRFIDVYGEKGTANGVEIRETQVGRANLDGSPVAREVRALNDLEAAPSNGGIRPDFVNYGAPEIPLPPMPEEGPIEPIP